MNEPPVGNNVGLRVELIYHSDPFSTLPVGTQGTIVSEDDLGTLFVDWDNGSKLGLIPGEDLWRVLDECN